MSETLSLRPRTAGLAITAIFGLVVLVAEPIPPVFALFLIVAGPLVAWAMTRSERFAETVRIALIDRDDEAAPTNGALPMWLGFVFVIVTLLFLEWRDPFFFTQDDNFSMGPVAIAAARGLLSGVFPTWNPSQFLGQPNSVQSIYGLTYPWTYIAFAFVHWLGHDNWFIEAFVIPHVLAGYWTTVWAARTLRVRPSLAVAASISFVLSGTVLMMSRSYSTMNPLVFWAPLLIVAAETLRRGSPALKWAAATALVVGLYCHSGNGQMWAYAVMFFGLVLLLYVFTGETNRRASSFAIAIAACFSLAISLLLIVPQLWFMQTVIREGGRGRGVFSSFQAMVLPMPLAHAEHPQFWGNPKYMASYYYAGTILTVCALAAIIVCVGVLLSCRGTKRVVVDNAWLLCALFALCIADGPSASIWRVMMHLPVFDKFTGPWKLLIFFHLFAALASVLILERLCRAGRISLRWERAVPVAVAALIALNAFYTRTAFYNYGDKPYPAMPPPLVALLHGEPLTTRGRVLPIGPYRSPRPGYALSMNLDFPSYYGVEAFAGYDPFVGNTNENLYSASRLDHDPLGAARAYGLRWILLHRSAIEKRSWRGGFPIAAEGLDDVSLGEFTRLAPHARLRLAMPLLQVWEIPGVDPMAFPDGTPSQPLPVAFDQAGVTVDVRSLRRATTIVVNVLGRRGMAGSIDGSPVELAGDDWGRCVVSVPPGASRVRIAYEPPWGTAAQASLLALLMGLILAFVSQSSGKAPATADRGAPAGERR